MNKSEIACRIKNAIEEKLCSLGAYVDKELPEYIFVMIANKKNKDSMAKDLQLFLGTETSVFIEWLHELLEKIQTNPEEAFRLKTEKPPKKKSSDVSDKKKKIDKEKQKVKSKSKKNDEKKEHKKSNLNKTSKVRSRSRSPVSELPRNIDSKKPKLKVTPDKMESKVIIKHSEIDLTKEDTTTTTTTSNHEVVEQKTVSIIASTVKVTERQPMKKEISKSSFEKIQRDLKEAEADITNSKIELSIVEGKPSQRKSVFNRLGTNDLRSTKLSRKNDEIPDNRERSPLKRTIHSVIKHDNIEHDDDDDIDIRESKIKRLEKSYSPSPNFIVTLNGLEKLNNVPLTSRLGPKRSQDKMESLEDEDTEEMEMMMNDPITDDSLQETKENNSTEIIVDNQTKCKFWPTCKNKETCPFVHPSEPCQAFPNCKFGALCLFIHPNCRFSSNCTKHDCPFTHYGPRSMSSTVKQIPHSAISRCLFYPNCTNVNCKFFHPNLPCKFGLGCMLKETCNFYHPTIPKSSDLKWKASQESVNTPSVIDTSSKKTEIQTV